MFLGIVSTGAPKRLNAILSRTALDRYFRVVEAAARDNVVGIAAAIRSLDVDAAATVYVGDHPEDCRAAKQAQVKPMIAPGRIGLILTTGAPRTGSTVCAASMPGRWAAPPAPAMITSIPRPAGWRTPPFRRAYDGRTQFCTHVARRSESGFQPSDRVFFSRICCP